MDVPHLVLELHDELATSHGGADNIVAKSWPQVLTKLIPLKIHPIIIATKSVPLAHLDIGNLLLAVKAGKIKDGLES